MEDPLAQGARALPAALLAGGRSSRMGGGDKFLIEIGGRSLLERAAARLRPQVGPLLLSLNGDPARVAALGLGALTIRADVFTDDRSGGAGPLAGVLTALLWAAEVAPGARWLATVAADTPLTPPDLVARLRAAVEIDARPIAFACSGGRTHPTQALWDVGLRAALADALAAGERSVMRFAAPYRPALVAWSTDPVDPFLNLNAPADVARWGATIAAAS